MQGLNFSKDLQERMPSRYSIEILKGLQEGNGKHVYAGTVPMKEKVRRRAANRRARQSRIVNRRR